MTARATAAGPVGAYPGTFNPPTRAHLAVAAAAREQCGLARVDLVVSVRSLAMSRKSPTAISTFTVIGSGVAKTGTVVLPCVRLFLTLLPVGTSNERGVMLANPARISSAGLGVLRGVWIFGLKRRSNGTNEPCVGRKAFANGSLFDPQL